jgi:hypothetical protein
VQSPSSQSFLHFYAQQCTYPAVCSANGFVFCLRHSPVTCYVSIIRSRRFRNFAFRRSYDAAVPVNLCAVGVCKCYVSLSIHTQDVSIRASCCFAACPETPCFISGFPHFILFTVMTDCSDKSVAASVKNFFACCETQSLVTVCTTASHLYVS